MLTKNHQTIKNATSQQVLREHMDVFKKYKDRNDRIGNIYRFQFMGTGRLLEVSAMNFSLSRLEYPDGFHEPMEIHDTLVITLLHELRDMPDSLLVSFRA